MEQERKKIVLELDYETCELLSLTLAGSAQVQSQVMTNTPMDTRDYGSMSAFQTISFMVFRDAAGLARTYVKLPNCRYLWL